MNTSGRGRGRETVLIVGCQRSGTTWIKLLLGAHEKVATGPESHLFDAYIRWWHQTWSRDGNRDRDIGLRAILDEDRFYSLLGEFAEGVLDALHERNPAATMIVEKTPDHARYVSLIRRVLPNARVLHVVRDPRAVVASMLAASGSWAKDWAPSTAWGCAKRWVAHVNGARSEGEDAEWYQEVRYEEMIDDPVGELRRLYGWLGLEVDAATCEEIVKDHELDRLKQRSEDDTGSGEPEGFYRKGGQDTWREELSKGQIRVIEYVSGGLMDELGYQQLYGGALLPPPSVIVRKTVGPARSRLGKVLRRVATRVEG